MSQRSYFAWENNMGRQVNPGHMLLQSCISRTFSVMLHDARRKAFFNCKNCTYYFILLLLLLLLLLNYNSNSLIQAAVQSNTNLLTAKYVYFY
jgi:hypothetical protein